LPLRLVSELAKGPDPRAAFQQDRRLTRTAALSLTTLPPYASLVLETPMLIQQKLAIQAPLEKVWAFFMDFTTMGRCLPGLEQLTEIDDRNYEGTFKARIGPISARFQGRVTVVELAPEAHRAAMTLSAKDPRAASTLQGRMTMNMTQVADGQTEVAIDTDVNVLGKLGQFGYWIFKKKASDMMDEFAAKVKAQVE